MHMLKNSSVQTRIQAVEALGNIGEKSVAGTLVKMLPSKNAELDEAIIVTLGKFRLKATEPLLIKMMQSKAPIVRKAAAWALGELDI